MFNNIAGFFHERLQNAPDEPASKRRRVDVAPSNGNGALSSANGAVTGGKNPLDAASSEAVLIEIRDISVAVPQRKKYDICFTKTYVYAKTSGTSTPVQGIVYALKDIGACRP